MHYYQGAYLPHEMQSSAEEGREFEHKVNIPVAPKALEAWMLKYPDWADNYRKLGNAIFAELDRFFVQYSAPPWIRKAAVGFFARSYRFPSNRTYVQPGYRRRHRFAERLIPRATNGFHPPVAAWVDCGENQPFWEILMRKVMAAFFDDNPERAKAEFIVTSLSRDPRVGSPIGTGS